MKGKGPFYEALHSWDPLQKGIGIGEDGFRLIYFCSGPKGICPIQKKAGSATRAESDVLGPDIG